MAGVYCLSLLAIFVLTLSKTGIGQTFIKNEEGEKLVAVQVIFRHGARTPDLTFPSDPYADAGIWPNGFSQLTCIGQLHCYNLGNWLKSRYSGFINTTEYVRKEILVQSSDQDRTIQSAYAVLSGLYLGSSGSDFEISSCDRISYTSVPVHTVPKELDTWIGQDAPCPLYSVLLEKVHSEDPHAVKMWEQNEEILKYFAEHGNFSKGNTPHYGYYYYYDALKIEAYFNMTLPSWAYKVLENQDLAYLLTTFYHQMLTFTTEMKRQRVGPLIHQLLTNFEPFVEKKANENGEVGKIFHLISGHDKTITGFLNALGLLSEATIPSYASALLLELRALDADFVIRLFYRHGDEDEEAVELEIPGCPSPCSFSMFRSQLSLLRVEDRESWLKECGAGGGNSRYSVVWTLITLVLVGLRFIQ